MFPFISKHKCSTIEQALSLLFLLSISYPSPTRTFYFKKGKILVFRWNRTHSSMILSIFQLQSSSLTTRPIINIINSSRSLTVKRSGFGFRKIFFFSSRRLAFVFRNRRGEGRQFGSTLYENILHYPIFSISSSHPPYFSLVFCEHEGLARVFKMVIYFENTLFSLRA